MPTFDHSAPEPSRPAPANARRSSPVAQSTGAQTAPGHAASAATRSAQPVTGLGLGHHISTATAEQAVNTLLPGLTKEEVTAAHTGDIKRFKDQPAIDPATYLSPQERAAHKEAFEKGGGLHAFISLYAHRNIKTAKDAGHKKLAKDASGNKMRRRVSTGHPGWGNWGQGTNFVGTKAEADDKLEQAKGGIPDLEDAYGIKRGDWAAQEFQGDRAAGKTATPRSVPKIYRYHIPDPAKLGMSPRIPTGQEGGAIPGKWEAGGKTDQGAWEAVIRAMSREQLARHVMQGNVRITKATHNGEKWQEKPANLRKLLPGYMRETHSSKAKRNPKFSAPTR